MLISLILPIYGVEKYIKKCIESCCNQKHIEPEEYEIILVDDSTPDKSIEIAKSVLEQYPTVNYSIVKRPNGGLSAARNTGLSYSSGEYVWFIDSDDWIESDALSFLKQTIKINPQAEVISFGHFTDYNTKSINHSLSDPLLEVIVPGISVIDNTNFYAAWNKIYKRSVLTSLDISFKEGILWEDGEFNLRVLPLIRKHYGLKESLYHYVRRPGSISTSNKVKHTLDSDLIKYESVNRWFTIHKLTDKARAILNRRNNEAVIFYLAGVPELNKEERKVYLKKVKDLKRQIRETFIKSDSNLQKILLPLIIYSPSVIAWVLHRKMQRLIANEDKLINQ